MKVAPYVTLVVLCGTLLSWATPGWAEVATAHAPQFDNKELWPHDVEKTAFYKQEWSPAPVMVWAKTNVSRLRVNHRDPSNWLIDGEPATRLPDKDTDVVIPDGDYQISSNTKKVFLNCRHATVGKGVRFGFELRAKGNVWIKEGGSVLCSSWSGPSDVFVRNDNLDFMDRRTQLANKIVISKASDASVELIGTARTGDEFVVHSGTFILGPDATFCPGDRSIQYIFPEATMIMHSGSTYHKRNNQHTATDLVVGGRLLIGTPDRPLSRDCTLALSRKSKGASTSGGGPDDYGLLVQPWGTMHINSADPQRARLVITHSNLPHGSQQPKGLKAEIPKRTDVVLQGDLKLDGILFDCMLPRGIHMPDPGILADWHVFFGENNDAAGDALFTRLKGVAETQVRYGDAPREVDGVMQNTKQLLEEAVEEAQREYAEREGGQ